MTELKVYN